MTENKRMANYELLRAVAMVMVVILHFVAHSENSIALDEPITGSRLVGTVLEFLAIAAVNTYVLISGYFGVKSSFRPSKAVALLLQIWFYALLIPCVLMAAGLPTKGAELGIYGWIQYLFPVETEHYWFATSYFMLYLLTPVLNAAIRAMSRRQLQIALGGLLILFSGIKSISPVMFAFDRYGYDLPWFICVYLVAAYLGLYGFRIFEKWSWFLYAGSSLVCLLVNIGMYVLAQRWDSFRYYFTVPYHYNYIFCLTAAIGLFYGFSKLRIKEGKGAEAIRRIGGLCFGVYLLHEHIDLRHSWYGWIRALINPSRKEGIGVFLGELVCCVVILFAAGIFVDYIRSRLFAGAALWLKNTRLSRFLYGCDREMAVKEGKDKTYGQNQR